MVEATKPYTLAMARGDHTETLFVKPMASQKTHRQTTILIQHTSRDSGETHSIQVPMTTNPFDLANYAPRDELLRNGEILRLINKRVLILVAPEEAEKILSTPEGMIESDRLQLDLERQLVASSLTVDDEEFRVLMPKDVTLEKGAKGDVNMEAANVSPAVAAVMTNDGMADPIKAAMLRNLIQMTSMTDADKRYVRSKTSDEVIRGLVA